MADNNEVLTVECVSERLKGIVSPEYQWPVVPEGYQLEFILHPDGSIILDFLSPEKAMFWSEAADELMETPYTNDKQPITWQMLKRAGIPFMS
ncbi:hypothetical protein [Vibrio fluvialis]|uniref:hypothetical protein n=1 Tax=Vibrio fluvialis TaxID=676 RepID=UPI001EEA4EF7|nr:hypothetical protein [Vibrio fluvialis]ELC3209952.1 hypothetical protein [Vibrio parahaemolyticus]MCG6414605.1 hypothetical protein [Vibrio fluvialis]